MTPQFASAWQHLPNFKKVSPTEYSSACPRCLEGSDRFRIVPTGYTSPESPRGWCRKCGHLEFDNSRIDVRVEDFASPKEVVRDTSKLEVYKKYHSEMTQEERDVWTVKHGVHPYMIDEYKLGACRSRNSLTIPFFSSGWKVSNMQHRLLGDVSGGKYRFTRGMGHSLFLTQPDVPLENVLLLEGAKKAIVTYFHFGTGTSYGVKVPYQIVAVPSKAPARYLLEELSHAKSVTVLLDPDASLDGAAKRLAKKIVGPATSFVSMPVKIDDAFIEYDMTPVMLKHFLSNSIPVNK